ncbi:polyprenyl synthetase family protein [Hasllibacter halocynthiae]|uniref:polyprenyl synthetase family protein n=1 Tax=Hasllibacter halocynthiae TaxID=595589 RepID=UPI000D057061|nr:polyprenyl synthetase family protein [Hasllibacter halocynthiae]
MATDLGAPAAARNPAAAGRPLDRLNALLAPGLSRTAAIIEGRMASDAAPRIPEVTAHLVGAGGKRVRPVLVLASAALCGETGEDAAKLAATVEFIHTATLLHDDVVDESRQRRGRPSANLLWDNQSSVLVGDYLFARAFQLMVEPGSLRVLGILSNAAATIAEGEVLQLTASRNLATDEATYLRVVRGKTAALFSAATEAGAELAGADAGTVAALRDYGDALGIAFQIADDLLDWEGGAEIGKNPGDDLREGKMSLPVIKAVASGSREFWHRTIELGRVDAGDFEQALDLVRAAGALDETRTEALGWSARAKAMLNGAPEGPVRDALADLADYVVARIA